MVNGNRLFATSVVPARAAVKLVLGARFAHFFENFFYFGFARNAVAKFYARKMLLNVVRIHFFDFKIFLARVRGHRHIVLYRRAVIIFHYGSAHTAADASGHFDKAIMYFALFDVFERGYAVFHAVYRKISITVGRRRIHSL